MIGCLLGSRRQCRRVRRTLLEEMISQEYKDRGRPKALCYEDIQLMVVRHPKTGEEELAMAIRLAHHKGLDNKPKP